MEFPFRFCKIWLSNTLFIFGRKNGRLFCLFIEALTELKKMIVRKKLFDVWLGNCSTSKVLIFCKFTGFTKMQLISLLDGRSVLDKLFFQNEVQRVLYKLVLVLVTLHIPSQSFSKDLQPFKLQVYSINKQITCVPITTIILPMIDLEDLELLRTWGASEPAPLRPQVYMTLT